MAIATRQAETPAAGQTRKPWMTNRQILLMNFGFFGVQYSFGMQQTAVNPIFAFLHANPGTLPILNLAGPILRAVPGEVAHKAPCDVLIVQTTDVAAGEALSA